MNLTAFGPQSGASAAPTNQAPAPAPAPALAPAPASGGRNGSGNGAVDYHPESAAFHTESVDLGRKNAPVAPDASAHEIDFDDMEFVDKPAPNGKAPVKPEQGKLADEVVDPSFESEIPKEDEETEESDIEETATDPADNLIPAKRDYSKLDPEVAKIARKLPNKLYAEFKDKLQEWKTAANDAVKLKEENARLTKEAPRYLAEHSEAYKLAPQFKEASELYSDAAYEENHWRQQLIAIKSGQPWVKLTGYRQDGSPVTEPQPAPEDGNLDVSSEVEVSQMLQAAGQMKNRARQATQQFVAAHKTYYQSAMQEADAAYAKFFPNLKPETFTKEEQNYAKSVDNLIPPAFKDHPLSRFMAPAFISVRRVVAYAKKLEDQIAAGKSKTLPTMPRRSAASAAGGSRGGEVVDLNKMFGPDSD
jgi:hypothetical protein